MAARNYRDLIVWQKAMDYATTLYEISKCFPADERYGLTSQIRRAAVSIPSNIAEGEGRSSPADFRRVLSIAHGSLRETETQLLLSQRFGYADEESTNEVLDRASEVGRLIQGLSRSLNKA